MISFTQLTGLLMKFQFNSLKKYGKPFLDLAIVITGVTVGFLLSNWSAVKKEKEERKKVLISLQGELNEMTEYFPSMATYQFKMTKTWDSLHNLGQLSDFNYYYYLQPQYNYSVIEYAINARNSDVIDFQLYEQLLLLYKHIKMLEEAEVYMTRLALENRPDAKGNPQINQANLFLFDRFIGFSRNRAKSLQTAHNIASKILTMMNNALLDS